MASLVSFTSGLHQDGGDDATFFGPTSEAKDSVSIGTVQSGVGSG